MIDFPQRALALFGELRALRCQRAGECGATPEQSCEPCRHWRELHHPLRIILTLAGYMKVWEIYACMPPWAHIDRTGILAATRERDAALMAALAAH
jgi:hypothetical protein